MNSNNPSNPNGDEIDLGQLFTLMGRTFDRFVRFVKSFFLGVSQLIMAILVFIQKNIYWLLGSLVLGLVIGFFLDKTLPARYVSKMVVEPNFNSVQQLYNNIEFYDDLAKANDSTTLASTLNISVSDASTIKKMKVDSYSDENQKVKLFDQFIRELDSTTVKAIDYDSYLANFNSLDARFHEITLIATDNRVAKKTQQAIIKSISNNDYFKLQKRINDVNLNLQDTIINKQLLELDSLQKLYKTILVKEAEKPMQGTNINLAQDGTSQNKELAIIKERELLKNQLVLLNQERSNKSTILNVISDFPSQGVKDKDIWSKYKVVLPLLLFGICLLVLLVIRLNTYLLKTNKNRKTTF